jgi:DNA-binding NarL/FixJ family response regulator
VLQLISLGLSDREIGKRLFVSRETVHTHSGRIFSKLGVSSRVQAALLARGHRVETEDEEASSHFPKSSIRRRGPLL